MIRNAKNTRCVMEVDARSWLTRLIRFFRIVRMVISPVAD